ncbi:hypothetical protein PVT67_15625 [Gallaecimonas kandeliae]|uniref:DUF7210 family protein n=1 Tax=Gallaecimonas kandeliae TaxID=3029055 RepID=UPI0026499E60|nr:hypothetical protein [Gallaecimonas kandeliae]WKE65072.1 hypothetical protein PVT67_15625 [Gallaecimonas kandeliae]
MSTAPKPATVEVVLLKDHKHGGKPFKKGATITVTAAQRQFLIERDIIAKNSPAVPATEKKG